MIDGPGRQAGHREQAAPHWPAAGVHGGVPIPVALGEAQPAGQEIDLVRAREAIQDAGRAIGVQPDIGLDHPEGLVLRQGPARGIEPVVTASPEQFGRPGINTKVRNDLRRQGELGDSSEIERAPALVGQGVDLELAVSRQAFRQGQQRLVDEVRANQHGGPGHGRP